MRAKFILVIGLCSLGLLTSCTTGKHFPNNCWSTCHNYSQCKNCVKLPCEHTCLACTFKEKACDDCWDCVSDEGCRSNLYPYNTSDSIESKYRAHY
ncbi:MAG: hypothetical protein JO149_04800 [Gammaproteobacteria bacterium]|nr:hypothetical protein [Gammaproteobacteria bacterium]